jgi:hypothetical protein
VLPTWSQGQPLTHLGRQLCVRNNRNHVGFDEEKIAARLLRQATFDHVISIRVA